MQIIHGCRLGLESRDQRPFQAAVTRRHALAYPAAGSKKLVAL
jgi:hypothetical protein